MSNHNFSPGSVPDFMAVVLIYHDTYLSYCSCFWLGEPMQWHGSRKKVKKIKNDGSQQIFFKNSKIDKNEKSKEIFF
jgi:hypothetical protein